MRHALIFSILLLSIGCKKPTSLSVTDYERWIKNEENGLISSKSVNNVNMKLQHLPAPYLAYREFVKSDSTSFDSILEHYKCGLTFTFSMQADKSVSQYANLLYYDVRGEEDLQLRMRLLSFGAEEFLSIQYGDQTYQPALAQYEGYDPIKNEIRFQIAFVVDEYKCGSDKNAIQDLTVTFDDPFWSLGKNHFSIEKKDLIELPEMKF